MSVDNIKKMYENLYNARYNELLTSKNNELADVDIQENKSKETYNTQRNTAAFNNAKTTQQIRDYMAKNNLLRSGENVDALLRNKTDFMNSMGTINTNEANFKNELNINRNRINSNFETNKLALQNQLSANAIKDINEYNERLRQEALQRELARASSGGGGGSYSSGITAEDTKNAMSSLTDDFKYYISKNDTRNARDVLFQGLRAYQLGLMTGQDYNNMQRTLTALEDKLAAQETANKKATGQKLQYGYRNGVAGWY